MLKDMLRASPESAGVRSRDILKFIRYISENKINLHSFLFAKGGRIIAEGYYPPFDENFLHRLYSSSKTYVALAIGMLVTEGRVRLSDKVISFFPEYDTDEVHPLVREYTVEDALTMSTPYYPERAKEIPSAAGNPYAKPCGKPAGTIFAYNDGAEVAADIVERVSGMFLADYLRPLLDKLGVGSNATFIKDHDGGAWGGSGMMSTLRDFAKVAEFIGQLGYHSGEQLIDRDYMLRMTSIQKLTASANQYSMLSTHGYGYLCWISPDAICMRGMGCQEAFYFPSKDFLFVCNGDTMTDFDYSDTRLYDAVKYFIFEEIGEPMADGEDYRALTEKLCSLELPRYGEKDSPLASEVSGVCYRLDENDMGWSYFTLNFSSGEGSLSYANARGEKMIHFGCGSYHKGGFPEVHYYGMQRGVPSGRELDSLAIAEWLDESTLLIRVYITDTSFGSVFIKIAFKDGLASLQLKKRGEFLLEDYGGAALGTRE